MTNHKLILATLLSSFVFLLKAQHVPIILKDIDPVFQSNPYAYTYFKGKIYFAAYDGQYSHLYKSDGTPEGTDVFKTVIPSPNSNNNKFVVTDDLMFFVGRENDAFDEGLWVTDGTVNGTYLVKDINPTGDNPKIAEMIAFENKLYFRAFDGEKTGLWVSDGTEVGTYLIKDFSNPSIYDYPQKMTVQLDKLFFMNGQGNTDEELWVSDGTAGGTEMLIDFGSNGSQVDNFTNYKGKLLFRASHNGGELWITDGTPQETQLLSGMWTNYSIEYGSGKAFVIYNDKIIYAGIANDDVDLWISDGTPSGSYRIKENYPTGDFNNWNFTIANNKVFFKGKKHGFSFHIWVTDGTEDGTYPVDEDLHILESESKEMIMLHDDILFSASDLPDNNETRQLWKVNTLTEEISLVKVLTPGYEAEPHWTYKFDENTVLFFAKRPFGGSVSADYALWKTDGTELGTSVVKAFYNYYLDNPGFTKLCDKVYFIAKENDGDSKKKLYISDGTTDGTQLVKPPGSDFPANFSDFPQVLHLNSSMVFTANFDAGDEPYIINCNATGTENPIEKQKKRVHVFPNPANEKINIITDDGSIIQSVSLYDPVGRTVFSANPENPELTIDLSSFSKGIYFLAIQTNETVTTLRKIIIN